MPQGADHLWGKILPLVDDYMTVTPGLIILKILLVNVVGNVIPIVQLSLLPP